MQVLVLNNPELPWFFRKFGEQTIDETIMITEGGLEDDEEVDIDFLKKEMKEKEEDKRIEEYAQKREALEHLKRQKEAERFSKKQEVR